MGGRASRWEGREGFLGGADRPNSPLKNKHSWLAKKQGGGGGGEQGSRPGYGASEHSIAALGSVGQVAVPASFMDHLI